MPIHGPTGASVHLRGVARGLQSLGHEVALVCPWDHDARGRWDVPLGVHGLSRPPIAWTTGLRSLRQRIDAERLVRWAARVFPRPDLIWQRHARIDAPGLRWARSVGARHVLEVNAPVEREQRRPSDAREVMPRTDRVVAVSPWLAAHARRCGARQVTVVRNCACPRD